jgi:AcrR family transcriptional regulator
MKQEKRQSLINTAMQLFVEFGYYGTPTSKISKEAGVAAGTLFNYFKTKDELLNQILIDKKQEMIDFINQNLDINLGIYTIIKHVWTQFMIWGQQNPITVEFFIKFRHSNDITPNTHTILDGKYTGIQNLILRGQSEDSIKKVDYELLFETIATMLDSNCRYFIEHQDKFEDEEQRENVFKMFWDCIKL